MGGRSVRAEPLQRDSCGGERPTCLTRLDGWRLFLEKHCLPLLGGSRSGKPCWAASKFAAWRPRGQRLRILEITFWFLCWPGWYGVAFVCSPVDCGGNPV